MKLVTTYRGKKDEREAYVKLELAEPAPSVAAVGMLEYAADHRRWFYDVFVPKVLVKKGQDEWMLRARREETVRIEEMQAELDRLMEGFGETCPTCGQSLVRVSR